MHFNIAHFCRIRICDVICYYHITGLDPCRICHSDNRKRVVVDADLYGSIPCTDCMRVIRSQADKVIACDLSGLVVTWMFSQSPW